MGSSTLLVAHRMVVSAALRVLHRFVLTSTSVAVDKLGNGERETHTRELIKIIEEIREEGITGYVR